MPLYQFGCDACGEEFEEFHDSTTIGSAVIKCSECGAKKARRMFSAKRGFGVIPDTIDHGKKMCVKIASDRWPKDKYGRPVVYSRTEERAVLKQVYIESKGTSQPISPYDH